MPAIDFPASPAVNDEYSFEGRTWRWNGTGWEVKEYPAALLAGTAANPSLYFSGDPNTGLYSPGADQVAISTGGTGRLFVNSDGSIQFGNPAATRLQVAAVTSMGDSLYSYASNYYIWGLRNEINDLAIESAFGGNIIFRAKNDGVSSSPGAATERLRITSTGNVGIGTSSPSSALDVEGIITAKSGAFDAGGFLNKYGSDANSKSWWVKSDTHGYGDFAIRQSTTRTGNTYDTKLLITSAGNVGIGTSSPAAPLHVAGNIQSGVVGVDGSIILNRSSDGLPINEILYDSATEEMRLNNGSGNGRIVFQTVSTERARIDSSGRLLVGTSSSRSTSIGDPLLQVEGTTYGGSSIQMICNSSSDAVTCAHLAFGRTKTTAIGGTGQVVNGDRLGAISWNGAQNSTLSSIAGLIECYVDGEVQTSGDTTDMPGRLVFSTTADGASSPTEAMRINNQRELLIGTTTRTANGGVLQISNGITFPGTQSACSDANTLDDYEEGTWTPVYSGTWTTTPTTVAAKYTKIGRLVHISIAFTGGAKSSATSGWITGLPFGGDAPGAFGGNGRLSDTAINDRGLVVFYDTRLFLTETAFDAAANYCDAVYLVA